LEPPDARVRALADSYLDGFFDRNPDQATIYGVPGRHHNRLPDNGPDALKAWQAKEDTWLAAVKQIEPSTITAAPLRATYAIVRDALEGSIGARMCRYDLWTVSQMVNGWQIGSSYLATIQPVGNEQARQEALARWSRLPHYIDTEIANLREGLKQGYSAPKGNVRLVMAQMDTLIATPLAESPFDSPSVRDKTPDFQRAFDTLVREQITPAFRRYRDFLAGEYLPAAREAIGVSANPNGAACYDASVRYHSSLAIPAKEVHEIGLQQIDKLTAEMKTIGERAFSTGDVPKLLQTVRTDKKYLFKSRAPAEDTAFHETIPGHHLQGAIALERKEIHPIGRYISNAGYAEGWGLYSERLADEMKLYSSDLDRLGMLSGQALRASRLVVDSGLHTMGWTRDRAIDYMLTHTAEPKDDVVSEIDRYIIYPGQATAYMLGELEIMKARDEARKAMGPKFDIKGFHDRVLEDGGVPVTFLTNKIRAWAAQ
jgi:uncharacterized protein (DUF885 family)